MGNSQPRIWAPDLRMDWSKEGESQLRSSILKKRQVGDSPVLPRILVFGPSGAGKSTLCNGIKSAVEDVDDVSTYFSVGSLGTSFTKIFQCLKLEDIRIWDMPGIFESENFKTKDIEAIARGEVSFASKMTENLQVQGNPGTDSEKNSVECVVIVISICMEVGIEIMRMVNCIMRLAGSGLITYRLVLTHVDKLDSRFKNPRSLTGIFDSPAVQEAVQKFGDATGIPLNLISVVRNYSSEMNTDRHSNILYLHTLEKMILSAYEQAQFKNAQQSG